MRELKNIIKGASKLEELMVVMIFIIMSLASFVQVLNRNFFHLPIGWLEELARYCQVYLALLAMELGLRDGSQMALTTVVDRLHGRIKEVVAIVAKLVVVLFSALMFTQAILIIQGQMSNWQKSPALKIPMFIPYLALPVSFGIASVVETGILIVMVRKLFGKKETGEENI